MEKYRNLNGNSGVVAYKIGDDYITVQFSGTHRPYVYSYHKAGITRVEKMKQLARKGIGLSTYISKYVKNLYD